MNMKWLAPIGNQRGVALPTAMLSMIILMGLTLALASLATTEPIAGRNHSLTAQARLLAESGLERAVWALTNDTATGGIPDGATPGAPYDGSQFLALGQGGFTVTVTNVTADERNIVAVGWVPTNDPTDARPKAVKRVQTTVMRIRELNIPCSLCVMGALQVGGNARIDGRTSNCAGITVQGGTMSTGTTDTSGNAKIWGPGNTIDNEPAPPGGVSPDTPANVSTSTFSFKLTDDEFSVLRSMARANNSYFTGSQSFSNSRPLPNGVVFIDTTTGANLTSTTPSAETGSVSISGNMSWSGWLIVAGEVAVSGTVSLTGMIYAQNDFRFTGNGEIHGAVVTENRKDTVADPHHTQVDSAVEGTANISYDCTAIRTGGGQVPTGWFVKPGTFMETAGR